MYTYSIIILKIARKINRNVDFPGFSKFFIRLSANPHRKLRKYIRRERTSRSFTRSFHVEGLKPEDIKASYKNGVLSVSIPKKEALPEKEESTRIEVGE